MPTLQVPRKLLLIHEGVAVFHDYKYEDQGVNDPLTYHYSLDEEGEDTFDVRSLFNPTGSDDHKELIRSAIDRKDLNPKKPNPELIKQKSLSGGQQWILATVYGLDDATTYDDLPNVSPLEEELFRRAATVNGREGVLSLQEDMLLSVNALFEQYCEND